MSKDSKYSKTNIITGFFWSYAERCGAQIVTFLVSVVLARLLSPDDYGTIAIVTVFTTILQVFVDSGLGTALVQKKNADEIDFSSVFYFNVLACLVLYAVMFLAAPYIAKFYGDDSLTAIVRVIGLTIIISGVKNIQQAYVSRNMLFKRFFFATLGGTVFSAFVGIGMALRGFGVWALVAQQISNPAIDTLILWITVKWRPRKVFSWKRLQSLLGYGSRLLASSLISTTYNNVRNLIIGKLYSTADLAYYNQGEKFPKLIVGNVNTSIDNVLLPAMSSEQENKKRVKDMTRRAMKVSVYIMAPLMIGMAFCAETIVRLVLTEKWIQCVPYLRIFCITYMFYPIHTANLSAIKAMGRSDLYLKMEICKKVVDIILLLVTMNISVSAMAYSLLASSVWGQIVNSWPNRKLLDYPYRNQLMDILPSILLACCMGGLVAAIPLLGWSDLPTLVVQVLMGAAFYLGGSWLLRMEEFLYLKNSAIKFLQGRHKGKERNKA